MFVNARVVGAQRREFVKKESGEIIRFVRIWYLEPLPPTGEDTFGIGYKASEMTAGARWYQYFEKHGIGREYLLTVDLEPARQPGGQAKLALSDARLVESTHPLADAG